MIIKSSKSDESNRKRLESLKQKADEFKQMKKINKMNLSSSLDDQQTKQAAKNQTTSKKIIFDDDDDDDEGADQFKSIDYSQITAFKSAPKDKSTSIGTRAANHVQQGEKIEEPAKQIAKKKLKLIDSDSDDEEQNEKDIKLLESKINLNQKQADKLIYLKTKFSNDDRRFKIDDRFIDELGSDEERRQKEEEEKDASENMPIKKKPKLERGNDENTDEEMNDEDEDEDSEEEDTSFDLKKEHLNSLKILEAITGKQLVKPVSEEKEKEKKKSSQKRMVRYDPTYNEHKVYELNDKESASEDEESKRNKTSKKNGESDDEAEEKNKVPIEDPSQYYKVDENLKDLFSSKDVFKFQFLGEQPDEDLNENDVEMQDKEESNKFNAKTLSILEKFNRNKVMLSSDDDESDADEDDDDVDENQDEEEENKETQRSNGQENKKAQMVESRVEKRSWRNSQINGTELDIFFPFNCDTGKKQIREALDFFHRPNKSVDELREEWFKQRVLMVQEYKRKHKRVLRIKRTKQNEKMLPWRKKKS